MNFGEGFFRYIIRTKWISVWRLFLRLISIDKETDKFTPNTVQVLLFIDWKYDINLFYFSFLTFCIFLLFVAPFLAKNWEISYN